MDAHQPTDARTGAVKRILDPGFDMRSAAEVSYTATPKRPCPDGAAVCVLQEDAVQTSSSDDSSCTLGSSSSDVSAAAYDSVALMTALLECKLPQTAILVVRGEEYSAVDFRLQMARCDIILLWLGKLLGVADASIGPLAHSDQKYLATNMARATAKSYKYIDPGVYELVSEFFDDDSAKHSDFFPFTCNDVATTYARMERELCPIFTSAVRTFCRSGYSSKTRSSAPAIQTLLEQSLPKTAILAARDGDEELVSNLYPPAALSLLWLGKWIDVDYTHINPLPISDEERAKSKFEEITAYGFDAVDDEFLEHISRYIDDDTFDLEPFWKFEASDVAREYTEIEDKVDPVFRDAVLKWCVRWCANK